MPCGISLFVQYQHLQVLLAVFFQQAARGSGTSNLAAVCFYHFAVCKTRFEAVHSWQMTEDSP